MSSKLSEQQILQGAYDEPNQAIKVEDLSTSAAFDPLHDAIRVENISQLVPEVYDAIQLSYIVSGPGTGQIGTVQYYEGGTGGLLVATLTLTYDVSNNLITVART